MKENSFWTGNNSVVVLLIFIVGSCISLMGLRHFGVISTRSLELELLPVNWTFEEIVEYLDAPYPDGATNIEYDSNRFDRAFFINVRFDAPPESGLRFAESICDGVLYNGYDPFNAIIGSERLENSNMVLLFGARYAYSENTPDTYLGNECSFEVGYDRPQYILVDTSNPNKYTVRFEIYNGGGGGGRYGTLSINGFQPVDFITPASEFPFLITGLMNTTDGYLLVTDQICFETRWHPYSFRRPGETVNDLGDGIYPDDLIGAHVQLKIDNTMIFDTTVSNRWTLTHPNQEKVDYDLMYNYCHFEQWQQGQHTMALQVATSDAIVNSFVWDIDVH